MTADELTEKMRRDWDARAIENSRYYIMNSQVEWSDEEFWKSGEQTVGHYVLTDMQNICQGKDPQQVRVLDFGCGTGRVTAALAKVFGEVHGVDISGEMVRQARQALAGMPNVHIHQVNGKDLDGLGEAKFDFAFAFSVFHHMPNQGLIESTIREAGKHLRAGGLFKFDVQGGLQLKAPGDDTWLGPAMTGEDMAGIAERCGFEARYSVGAGEESFWQWFFKR